MDNNGMRGELDLMLAEAELQNLRRQKDLPWSWNRHALAVCLAMLLVLAGLGGWCYANKGTVRVAPAAAAALDNAGSARQHALPQKPGENNAAPGGAAVINSTQSASLEKGRQQQMLSQQDMRRLVQSARSELSSSK